jgi:hypothetical protein
MEARMDDVPAARVVRQRVLRANVPDLADRFARLTEELKDEVNAVLGEQAQGGSVPENRFADIVVGRVSATQVAPAKRHGCAVIRGVHDQVLVEEWNEEVVRCIGGRGDHRRSGGRQVSAAHTAEDGCNNARHGGLQR